jgi:hypothetical protein
MRVFAADVKFACSSMLHRRANCMRRALVGSDRRQKRIIMQTLLQWHRRAFRQADLAQRSDEFGKLLCTRKRFASMRSWFYYVCCMRGVHVTRQRKMYLLLRRVIFAWRLRVRKGHASVILMEKFKRAKIKGAVVAWRLATTLILTVIAAWAGVLCHVMSHLKEETIERGICRLCRIWRGSVRLTNISKETTRNLQKMLMIRWRESTHESSLKVLEPKRIAESLQGAMFRWKCWVDEYGTTSCKMVELGAKLKRTRLAAICRRWNFQAHLSAAQFRIEVSFGIWRMHAQLQRTIMAYVYKRGVSRAHQLANIVIYELHQHANRQTVRRQVVKSVHHSLMRKSTKTWIHRARVLGQYRIVVSSVAIRTSTRILQSAMRVWQYDLKNKTAFKRIRAMVVEDILAITMAGWCTLKCKQRWLQRVVAGQRRRFLQAITDAIFSRWTSYTHHKIRRAKAERIVSKKSSVLLMQEGLDKWISHIQRCKRLCATQVLIIRSGITVTASRVWRRWCIHAEMQKALRYRIRDHHISLLIRNLSRWSLLANDSVFLSRRLAAFQQRITTLQVRHTLKSWHANVRLKAAFDKKVTKIRLRLHDCLKREAFLIWSLTEMSATSEFVQEDTSMVRSILETLTNHHCKSARKHLCRRVTDAWKQRTFARKAVSTLLGHVERRRVDRATMSVFFHWNLTLVLRSQLWCAYERMRSRRVWYRLVNFLKVWKDAHFHIKAIHCACLRIGHDLKVRRNIRQRRSCFLQWKGLAGCVQASLAVFEFAVRNEVADLVAHCFVLWVSYVSDSVNNEGPVADNYVNVRRKIRAWRHLKASFIAWHNHLTRRKVLEDLTINVYSKRRLRRIEKQVCECHVYALLRLAFCQIGACVQERLKFQQKLGDLRSNFACTGAILAVLPTNSGMLQRKNFSSSS